MQKHTLKTTHLLASTFAGLALCLSACGNNETKTATEATTENVQAVPYTWNQKLFCLNILSNVSAHWGGDSNIHDSTTWAVKAVLADQTVQSFLGNWQCVWGPVVITGKTDTPANTMFIAQEVGTNNFVVAIAGTDPTSEIAAVWEDADVTTVFPWSASHPLALISQGTRNGLTNLQSMEDPNSTLADKTAYGYLKSQAQANSTTNVWVTGHSLGGFFIAGVRTLP